MPGPDSVLRPALQLYTVREQMAADTLGTLRAVAAAGYPAVELAGYGTSDPGTIRRELDSCGMAAVSLHRTSEDLSPNIDGAIEDALTLGCEYLVVSEAREEDWASLNAVHRLSDTLEQWGARVREAGLWLGYHGYHPLEAEFADHDGTVFYDVMVDRTSRANLHLQLDTYWLHTLGRDPVAALRAAAGGVPTLHLKESAGAAGAGDTALGQGILDWADILDAARAAGTRWVIVEQEDAPQLALEDAAASLAFLEPLLAPGGASSE